MEADAPTVGLQRDLELAAGKEEGHAYPLMPNFSWNMVQSPPSYRMNMKESSYTLHVLTDSTDGFSIIPLL